MGLDHGDIALVLCTIKLVHGNIILVLGKITLVHGDMVLFSDSLAHSCTLSPCYVATEIKIDNRYREPYQRATAEIAFLGN